MLACSLHPKKEKDEEDIARALTPTKSIPVSVAAQNPPEVLVLPGNELSFRVPRARCQSAKVMRLSVPVALVDDRLQTSCNKSGKHHCHCEEEDASPLSPTIRSNSERKRRRSLPCGPAENLCVTPAPMPSLQESILQETKDNVRGNTDQMTNNRSAAARTLQNRSESRDEVRTRNNLNSDHLERCFKAQLNIEDRDNGLEKSCKRTAEVVAEIASSKTNVDRIEENYNKGSINPGRGSNGSSESKAAGLKGALLENLGPFAPQLPSGLSWSFVSSWQNSNMNSKFQSFCGAKEVRFNDSERSYKPPIAKDTNVAIDPYAQPNPFHESNPGPSTYNNIYCRKADNSACTVHQSCFKNVNKTAPAETVTTGQDALEVNNKEDNTAKGARGRAGKDFSQLMWKLSFPNEKDKQEEGGILDWFSRVPGRVLGVTAAKGYADNKAKGNVRQPEHHHQGTNEIKFKNCNLELSPREVNEVLAVLRARTPSGRRRATVKNVKRRERSERAGEEGATDKLSPRCASSESANTATSRVKSCELYDCKRLCKKTEHPSGELAAALDRVYYDKNVYQPAHSKFSEPNRWHEEPQAAAANRAERLRNVSNKADVLLGAILRNGSRDRKGQSLDISNGTRPRSTTSIDDDDSDDSRASLNKLEDHHRTGCTADEKSLPLAVNKRFNKIRQLFKREDDRRTTEESSFVALEEEPPLVGQTPRCSGLARPSSRYNNTQPANLHNPSARSKTKRRIDFANFPETAEKKGPAAAPGLISTKDAHQKPPIHSTNHVDRDPAGLNRQNNCDDRLLVHAMELAEDERDDTRDTAVLKNNLTAATIPQNGHSSSKARNNNNHKDGVAEDDETVDRGVPSALEQERFRRSLENAASMVFHSRTGLPLTSSPAPLRRGSCCFDYDSSLNSVSSKRRYDAFT